MNLGRGGGGLWRLDQPPPDKGAFCKIVGHCRKLLGTVGNGRELSLEVLGLDPASQRLSIWDRSFFFGGHNVHPFTTHVTFFLVGPKSGKFRLVLALLVQDDLVFTSRVLKRHTKRFLSRSKCAQIDPYFTFPNVISPEETRTVLKKG